MTDPFIHGDKNKDCAIGDFVGKNIKMVPNNVERPAKVDSINAYVDCSMSTHLLLKYEKSS